MKKLILILVLLCSGFLLGADGFIYLVTDGIKVHIDDIVFGYDYANHETTASITLDRTVNLTGNPNDVFSGGITLYLERAFNDSLQFDHININMSGGVEIKAHGYLGSNVHVYTTTSGIASYTGTSTWSAPSNYGYLPKDYIYVESDGGEQNETTFMTGEVSYPSSSVDINLLVDTYNVAYYWDGDNSTRHGFVDSWNQEDSSLFPANTEVIGLSYIPFYVSVNQDLVAETYVVSTSANNSYLNGLPDIIDEKYSMYLTLVFDKDTGDFFIGRTANWDGLHDYTLNLPQFVRSGTLSGGAYTLELYNYDNQNGGWTNNQTITNFVRSPSTGLSGNTATVDPGSGSTYNLNYYRVK